MNSLETILDKIHSQFLKFHLRSSKNRANLYREIQAVEDDSAWQLHRLYLRVEEPKARSKVFLHILEEEGHAKIFKDGYLQESKDPFIPKSVSRLEIENESAPAWKFFAHLSAGELDAANYFMKLSRAMDSKYLNEGISQVLNEEIKHVSETVKAPSYLKISQEEYQAQIKNITSKRQMEALISKLQLLLNFVINIIFFCIYLIGVPFFTLIARKRLQVGHHVYKNNHRKVF